MEDKRLSEQEYLAIDSILEDAERKYLPKNSVAFDLESLDQQCRDIWSDWDFSVPAFSKSPNEAKTKTNITSTYVSKYEKEKNRLSIDSSDDDSNINNTENIQKISNISQTKQTLISKNRNFNVNVSESDSNESSDDTSDSEIIRRPSKSPIRSPINLSGKYSSTTTTTTTKSKNKSRKKSPFKSVNTNSKSLSLKSSINSKSQLHTYDRADVARLRQDNISLRAMVSRLQDALDRANYENARLKEELNKSEMNCMRQKGIISYLKEQKLYGKK